MSDHPADHHPADHHPVDDHPVGDKAEDRQAHDDQAHDDHAHDDHAYSRLPIEDLYTWFAGETAPTSPLWQDICCWVAATPSVSRRLAALPGRKRQPNLFLGALRYLDAPLRPDDRLADWVAEHWPRVEALILARRTQTNDPGRCAVLAPLLASLPQPITLLELGASAGLCLWPDLYAYRYRVSDDTARPAAGAAGAAVDGDAVMDCVVEAGRPPGDVSDLRVSYRAGLDSNPLNPSDPDDVRWLRSLVWPGDESRERRLAAALALVGPRDTPMLTADLRARWTDLLSLAAESASTVLMHSATLAYLTRPERDEFVDQVGQMQGRRPDLRWVSFEGPGIITSVAGALTDVDAWQDRPNFVLALDGEPVARCGAHGSWVRWY